MIRELTAQDAPALAKLLAAQRPEYLAHFHPFDFNEPTLARILADARRDRFWALCLFGEIVGFFMLRGFDACYGRPSYGVFIAESAAGRGLARTSLDFALKWCAENAVERVFLKVAPDNLRAHALYKKAGFENIGACPATGHEMLERRAPFE